MEFTIHRLKMASTLKKGRYIAPNVPLWVHILAAGLDIARESAMAKFAERDALCLTLFASYKYIQFLHLLFGLNLKMAETLSEYSTKINTFYVTDIIQGAIFTPNLLWFVLD